MSSITRFDFAKIISKALEEGAEKIVTEEIDEAQKRVEARMKDMAAGISVSLTNLFVVNEFQDRLVITINHKFPEAKP